MKTATCLRRRRGEGFTLIEVLVATVLLGLGAVATAQPIKQGIMAAAMAADHSAALHYSAAGLEYAREETNLNYEDTDVTGSSTFVDANRGITYWRMIQLPGPHVKDPNHSYDTVLYRVSSETTPYLTTEYAAGRHVKRVSGVQSVRLVTFQCKWLSR